MNPAPSDVRKRTAPVTSPELTEALDGLVLPRGALLFLREVGRRRRVRQSGQDGIRGDSVGGHVVGQASHESDDGHLRVMM